MKKLRRRDLRFDCGHVVETETEREILEATARHALKEGHLEAVTLEVVEPRARPIGRFRYPKARCAEKEDPMYRWLGLVLIWLVVLAACEQTPSPTPRQSTWDSSSWDAADWQ